MSIVIKGNKGKNIGGDFIRADVFDGIDLQIEGNEGENIAGSMVNLNESYGALSKLRNAIQVVREHMDEFPAADRDKVEALLNKLDEDILKPDSRSSNIVEALRSIGHMAAQGSLKVISACVEGAMSAFLKIGSGA